MTIVLRRFHLDLVLSQRNQALPDTDPKLSSKATVEEKNKFPKGLAFSYINTFQSGFILSQLVNGLDQILKT